MLYQQQTGSGKTIIFIHGNSQSSAIWDDLILETSLAGYTLVRIDLPGHGQSFRSTDPEKDYTLKGMASHLKDCLLKIEAEEYVIVALSLATNLIAEVIDQLPQCKGLFLTGASIIGTKFTVPEIVQPNPHFAITFSACPTDDELTGFLDTWTVHMNRNLKEKCIQIFRDTDSELRNQMGKAIAEADWSDEVANLEQLTYPVAVVYGKEEKIVFPDYLNRSSIRTWRDGVILIPDAGHCCQLDQPKEMSELINQYATDIFRSSGF